MQVTDLTGFYKSFSQTSSQDTYYMLRAIELAKKGQYTTRPNPCVGCVIVKDGQIIGEGYHYQAGQPHAEVFALRQAGDNTKDATVYVTLEPCSHHGRTPPCADALIKAKVKKVVIAVTDPNPKVAGGGIAKLQQAGIGVVTGVCHDEAYALNLGFFATMSGRLPFVRLKIACSLDGKIAMNTGESKWITGESAREDVQRLRAKSGAIITGSQTILADLPLLNVRSESLGVPLADIQQPLLVVLDRRQRIDKQSDWYQHQAKNRPILLIQEDLSLEEILLTLKNDYQIHDVMVEAGASLSTSFLTQDLVDELIVYQAPCLLGKNGISLFNAEFQVLSEQLRFNFVSHETIGQDLRLLFKKY